MYIHGLHHVIVSELHKFLVMISKMHNDSYLPLLATFLE